jgi:signal transduction histidine kinase/ligand-binding sensor domain-containing protein
MMQLAKLLCFLCFTITGFSQELPIYLQLNTSNGLSQNTVWAMEKDYAQRIWLGTQEGLQIYDGYNLTTVPTIKETILALYHTDSTMYCITLGNLYKIDELSFQFTKAPLNTTDYYYHSFSNSTLSITSSDGLKTANFDLNLQLIDSIQHHRNSAFECDVQLGNFKIEGDINGIRYFKNLPHISAPKGMTFQLIEESHEITSKYCTQFIKYNDQHIFISSHDGLIEIINQNNDIIIRHHFTNHRIERLMIDHNKNLWVGTADVGAFLIHENAILSTTFPIKNEKKENLTCWHIFEIDSNMFVSTNEGIRPLSQTNTQHKTLLQLTRKYNCLTVTSTPNFMLIGTGENGILKLKNNTLTPIYNNPNQALDNTIMQIIKNDLGYLAISKKSFIQLDKTGTFLFSKKYEFKTKNTYAMYLESINSGYRVSTFNGTYLLDNQLNIQSKYALQSAKVISMTTEFQGDIWASTFDSGLINLSTDKVLSSNTTSFNFLSIQNHNNQSLWASSNTGIINYSPPFIRPYSKENGFSIHEYNQLSVFKNTNNELYYGGNGVVIKFHPDSLSTFPEFPSVIITHDTTVLLKSSTIQLPFDQGEINLFINPVIVSNKNYFQFEILANGVTHVITKPQNLSFKIPTENSNITLKIIDTVHYTTQEYTYYVYRQIPFWKKTWFIIAVIIIGITLVIGLYSFIQFLHTKRLLKIEQAENQVNEERLRISKELHDNIGARLTHIISSLDIEVYRNKDESNTIETINAFARDTMTQLRETIWAVSDKTIFFSEFITRIAQYVEQINDLASQNIVLIKSNINDFELNPIQTINYYRIVQEAINNAVKYADASEIKVAVNLINTTIVITITDNGKGFDLELTRLGMGIIGMKSRAEEVDSKLEIKTSVSCGTTVLLHIKQQ